LSGNINSSYRTRRLGSVRELKERDQWDDLEEDGPAKYWKI